MFKEYTVNHLGQDYVCGDIHGQYDKLINTLKHLNFNYNTDRLFCVGDMVDRGLMSKEVFDLLGESWFYSVRGNHEVMMFNALKNPINWDWWQTEGGRWIMPHLEDQAFRKLILWAEDALPVAIQVTNQRGQKIGICHAECPTHDWQEFIDQLLQQDNERTIEHAIWSRTKVRNPTKCQDVANIDMVVSGHTVLQEPLRRHNMLFIDTGAVFGGQLTVLNLNDLDTFEKNHTLYIY